jgi:Holliday junction DNA helicase RuvA
VIAKLSGLVDAVGEGSVVIDVGGVGYLVSCSGKTLSRLSAGQTVSLLVETQVREDAIQLYGFLLSDEKLWFRLLTTVQGVGAKGALAVLSVLAPEELVHAIAMGDRTALTRASGVGPKLAARVIGELKDKVPALAAGGPSAAVPVRGAVPATTEGEAVSALVNLGFKPLEARTAVTRAATRLGTGTDVEALIRGGLAELTTGSHAP